MGNYDFDKVIDRTGTHAVKLEALKRLYGRTDLLRKLYVSDWNILCSDIRRCLMIIGLLLRTGLNHITTGK